MKKLILVSVLLSSLSFAQQKFACIDPNRILQESQTAKKAQEGLRNKFQFYQNQLDEMGKKLEELKKQIESKAISQKMREEKIKEYQKLEAEAIELQQKAQKELNELRIKTEDELTKKIKEISEDISKKANFTGVLDCSVFVYRSAEIDITDEVIKRLDAK
ncbi:OmpH family outer membrane protein [Thermocrinis sp.]|uniref:OmpH family outer membrane protein n=1 Tax=Thermocrinis sp. TaxID=2024383 RepID=UPI002FDD85B7